MITSSKMFGKLRSFFRLRPEVFCTMWVPQIGKLVGKLANNGLWMCMVLSRLGWVMGETKTSIYIYLYPLIYH